MVVEILWVASGEVGQPVFLFELLHGADLVAEGELQVVEMGVVQGDGVAQRGTQQGDGGVGRGWE